jgi:hypothetical protein
MAKHHGSEAELAAGVVAWLHSSGAEVYQEVEVPGGIADIVACVGAELWIIETKLSLSLTLLVQAMDRRRLAHRVYCAAPRTRTSRDFGRVCKELGVGLLEVYTGGDNTCVKEAVASRRWNRRPAVLEGLLRAEHQTHAVAGTNGGRWIPFRDTCAQLLSVVTAEPGIQLRDAIETIRDHYSSKSAARSHMARWIATNKAAGVLLVEGALWPTGGET